METNGYHDVTTNGHTATGGPVQHNTSPFYGHDREEVTRILLQSLSDLGYAGAAKQLSEESGFELEIPSVAAFRSAVLRGEWEEAELLLFGSSSEEEEHELDGGGVMLGNGHGQGHTTRSSWHRRKSSRMSSFGSQNGFARNGLPLAEGADVTTLKFLLRQQKYLELLENGDVRTGIVVLRKELTPLKRDIGRVHALSACVRTRLQCPLHSTLVLMCLSLMMCPSAPDLRAQADWDGSEGSSRANLLSDLSNSISPSVMIPEHRLATLFTAVQNEQILNCRYHNTIAQPSLYTDHECAAEDFPLQKLTELRNHSDEVWFLEFSHDGSMLATAGKDGLVCVYDTVRWKVRHEFREHERNSAPGAGDGGVCYVAFSPDDQYLISCSQNNEFIVVNVRDGRRVAIADHFDYPVTTAAWLPDSQTFVVGSQGSRRPLGLYSLRSNSSSSSSVVRNNEIYSWRDPPWDPSLKDNAISFRIADCAVSPDGTRMVAATIDKRILMYDLRSRYKIAEWEMKGKLTSINFSADGAEMLVNMNEEKVWALDSVSGEVLMKYEGAVQREYVVRSCFGGAREGVVVSGSEGEISTYADTSRNDRNHADFGSG